jgi:uncharacterized protein (UPF0276 family)
MQIIMASAYEEFSTRVTSIPTHGVGLSVDVYSPDLFDLVKALQRRGLRYGYLEIFKASQNALAAVRSRLPAVPLEYHGEGLWVPQPMLERDYPFERELETAAAHLAVLGSRWINYECASKQLAGYSFGTYLPPLFTRAAADVAAQNARLIQRRLEEHELLAGAGVPLLLLEVPPLTYFAFGDITVPEFFRRLVQAAPCGLVLDIGHVWTIYRYGGGWRRRPLEQFLAEFLDKFPLERVVQIHVAGLSEFQTVEDVGRPGRALETPAPPPLIDAHAAPIPEVLFDMLAQVLEHPRLSHLKALALEVDTKPIPQIVEEFAGFQRRFAKWFEAVKALPGHRAVSVSSCDHEESSATDLLKQYDRYAYIVADTTGSPIPSDFPGLNLEFDALERYRRRYLPNEILHWGGELLDMFPNTCERLKQRRIPLSSFVDFWFHRPEPAREPYDFFQLKLDRFAAFVEARLPEALPVVQEECEALRQAALMANESIEDVPEPSVAESCQEPEVA